MPITYDEEKKSWQTKDLTESEKESLFTIGFNYIVASFGQQVGDKIMDNFMQQQALEDTPPENMYTA